MKSFRKIGVLYKYTALILFLPVFALLVLVMRNGNPFPIPALNPGPTFSFPTPDRAHWLAALRVIEHYNLGPSGDVSSPTYPRALGKFGSLFNVPPADEMEEFGDPGGAFEIHCDNPMAEANRTAEYYRSQGFGNVHPQAGREKQWGENAVVLVSVPGQNWVWVFLLPRYKLGGKPPAWKWPEDSPARFE